MKHLGLFAGIGGFELAARWMGWETVAWCEINPFCQKVLKRHFPEAVGHEDIKTTDFKIYANRIDVITGGFPCQPYSTAGKRKGKEDERHLWPEMLRAIREVSPRYVVGENVRGLTNWNGGLVFDEMQSDLEAEGYEVLPFLLPACALNAPHRRDRIWFIAHNTMFRCEGDIFTGNGIQREKQVQRKVRAGTNKNGPIADNNQRNRPENGLQTRGKINVHSPEGSEFITDAVHQRSQGNEQRQAFKQGKQQQEPFRSVTELHQKDYWLDFPTQPPVCSGDDGIPRELDGITFPKWRNESIKAFGNAVVPQIPFEIFKVIEKLFTH